MRPCALFVLFEKMYAAIFTCVSEEFQVLIDMIYSLQINKRYNACVISFFLYIRCAITYANAHIFNNWNISLIIIVAANFHSDI